MMDTNYEIRILRCAVQKGSHRWADASPMSDGSYLIRERGGTSSTGIRVGEVDIGLAVEKILSGSTVVDKSYVEKLRLSKESTFQLITKDVADMVLQVVVFEDVPYWGHVDDSRSLLD